MFDDKGIVIFDRDGTLSSCDWRVKKFLRNSSSGNSTNWSAFFEALEMDEPIPQTVALAHMLRSQGFRLYLWTGIPKRFGGSLKSWLSKSGIDIFSDIRMRGEDDYRKDFELKRAWLEMLSKSERESIFAVFENDEEIFDMYLRAGVQALLVRDVKSKPFYI